MYPPKPNEYYPPPASSMLPPPMGDASQYYPLAPNAFVVTQEPQPWSTGLCDCTDDCGNCRFFFVDFYLIISMHIQPRVLASRPDELSLILSLLLMVAWLAFAHASRSIGRIAEIVDHGATGKSSLFVTYMCYFWVMHCLFNNGLWNFIYILILFCYGSWDQGTYKSRLFCETIGVQDLFCDRDDYGVGINRPSTSKF